MLAESQDEEQIIARVAAIDIGKAELVCCVRVPAEGNSNKRLPMFKDLFLRRSGRPDSRTRTGTAIAAAAVLTLGLAACGGASGETASSGNGPSSGSKTIRMGHETGAPGGFINALAEEVFTDLGYKVEMIPMEFKALIPSLQSGRIDVAGGGLYITPPRCKAVVFSEPSQYYQHAMVVPKGNSHNLKTFEDVAKTGVKLGVPTGSDEARQAKAAGVQESQISTYQDISTALDAVQTGRVDVVSYDNVTLATQLAKPAYSGLEMTEPTNPTFDDGQKRPYAAGIAFPKKDSELAKQYSEKQAELFKEGTKTAEFAKKESVPEASVPKAGDTFTTADYCAHAGT